MGQLHGHALMEAHYVMQDGESSSPSPYVWPKSLNLQPVSMSSANLTTMTRPSEFYSSSHGTVANDSKLHRTHYTYA